MGFIKDMFSESSGVSSIRVMGVLCTLSASSIGLVSLYQNKDLSSVAILVGSFLVPAFGGKVAQKAFESKES